MSIKAIAAKILAKKVSIVKEKQQLKENWKFKLLTWKLRKLFLYPYYKTIKQL